MIHAKSEAEASEIRKRLPRAKVRVVPNPIETPPQNIVDGNTSDLSIRLNKDFFQRAGILLEHKILLFMGRVHPVKGLEHLLNAWTGIYETFPDWHLVIIGPDEGGFRSKLKSMICNNSSNVAFIDPLFGEDRWTAYKNADLFVAPSEFENFGQSIAEALSVGVPVITTIGTPWKELKEKNCGWWIDPTPESIADALQEAMSLSDSERKAKGEAGKNIVEQFLPSIIAEKMCELYSNCAKAK
jgi:glycosyltransferase involved in cell wall biosynthesis